jgi:hypothetical protein
MALRPTKAGGGDPAPGAKGFWTKFIYKEVIEV